MKPIERLKTRWVEFTNVITRFPLTFALLFATVITISIIINQKPKDLINLVITFLLGAALYVVLQLVYESFFDLPYIRFIFMGVSALVSFGYYLIIDHTNWNIEVTIRTIVLFFILLIAFFWVPAIRGKINFNDSFMAVFKAFFLTVFFNGVFFLGICLIFMAVDTLIVPIIGRTYEHAANIIFVLLAPTYFLSLIPEYSGKNAENQEDAITKAITPSKFLETLISFVVIPVTAVFTIILVLYIIMNITGSFWTNNLLEPLLVTYSITVIIVYLLAAKLENIMSVYFRRIFPKVLVPVVLFQTLSSVLRIGTMGVTYSRYYVILFGVFATIAGILFCLIPVHKNGIIAPILIILALLSIVPPVDAFTLSKNNQTTRLKTVLERNNMLEGDVIIPNKNISKEDQETILHSLNYLNQMQYTEQIAWLKDYRKSMNIEQTFGFTGNGSLTEYKSVYINRNMNSPITITGYDYYIKYNIYTNASSSDITSFTRDGNNYFLRDVITSGQHNIVLSDEADKELIRFDVNEIYQKYKAFENSMDKLDQPTQEVSFSTENEAAILTVVADSITIIENQDYKDENAVINILVKIK
jgi:hypothetical protein